MNKYKMTYSITFTTEADNVNEAMEKAKERLFAEYNVIYHPGEDEKLELKLIKE